MTEKKEHAAFIRWQEVTRAHLGHTINLVLALTTAAVGFAVNLVVGKIIDASVDWCAFFYSILVLISAVAFGLAANYTRLWDFRWTTRAARGREMHARLELKEVVTPKQEARARDRDKYSNYAETLGKITWWLLLLQLLAFFAGIVLLAWSFRVRFWPS